MHEASLSSTVLAVLRRHPGAYRGIRVHVGNPATPAEELAATLRVHLMAADPPVTVGSVEVVPHARPRTCAACLHGWTSAEAAPACPACGGAPLPLPHDHTVDIELLA